MSYYTALHLGDVLPEPVQSQIVWHYTTSAGVLGILASGGLWMNSTNSMNDASEIAHGASIIEQRWSETKHLYRHRELINSILSDGITSTSTDIFVACASTVGDSLSQFRAYGPYALGLDINVELRTYAADGRRENEDFSTPSDLESWMALRNGWRPVLYDSPSQLRLVDRFLLHLDEKGDNWPDDDGTDSVSYAHQVAASQFVAVAAHLKHEAFSDEREVRLFGQLSSSNSAVQIRDGRFGLTPYFLAQPEMHGPASPRPLLTSARIGPGTVDPRPALAGLALALTKYNHSIQPEVLDIPFR